MKKMRSGEIFLNLKRRGDPEPIYHAAVIVGKGDTAQTFLTDADGSVEIPYAAPPAELSFMRMSMIRPYSVCDILVSAPDIDDIHIIGCQVFSGVDTLLNCEVQPHVNGTIKKQHTVRIPVHGLWAENPNNHDTGIFTNELPIMENKKITERAKNELDAMPEFLKVHLGRAKEVAVDKTVSFSDYIKNVASGTIYPTWPKEVLQAYILSLITTVRRRLSNGYYHNFGYAFDMAAEKYLYYSDGRMVSEPICKITDELIDQYIITDKELLLSPWQYLPLAQKGLKPDEILKHFYGNELKIETSKHKKVENFTESLVKGSVKSEVKVIQQLLNLIALHYPSIPIIREAEGYFGACTEASVKAYQRLFKLPVTGCIDPITWQSIVFVGNSLKKYTDVIKENKTQGKINTEKVALYGDTGSEVLKLQHTINSISRKLGEKLIKPVDISGDFDERTRDSVTSYQKYKHLPQSGVVDKETWSCLCADNADDTSSEIKTKKYPGTPVVKGAEGENVVYIQLALNAVQKTYSGETELKVDGIYGNETHQSIVRIQALLGLDNDGTVDEKTWNALTDEYLAVTTAIVDNNAHTGYFAEG